MTVKVKIMYCSALLLGTLPANADNFTSIHVTGNTPVVSGQGLWLQWNRNNGDGNSWILNQPGQGSPGINLGESDSSNNVTISATFTPTAATLPGNLTVTGTAYAKTIASTANGTGLATAAWVKQFFPGLSTNVEGTGTPGLDGGQWFAWRTDTTSDLPPVIRVDRNFNYSGGTAGNVTSAHQTNCTLGTYNPANYVWCNATYVTSTAYGNGQHVALASTMRRLAFSDGNGARAPQWAGYFEDDDRSGLNSDQAGVQIGIENDIYAHGTDTNHKRILLQMEIGDQYNGGGANVGYGILFGRNDNVSSIGTGLYFNLPIYESGINFSNATFIGNAPAILLKTNESVCFEVTLQKCVKWDGSYDNFGSATLSAAGYNTVSDMRLKTDVHQLESNKALEIVRKLSPVDFKWLSTESFAANRQYGFLAQDMQNVVPEVVGVDQAGFLSIDYTKLVPILAGAIQDESKQIEVLRQKLARVEKQ